ncbi:MAG TPA: aminodeoxychorismate synthase component I [Steroidobacteraceae bacterium]|nr:aminodeoxychorismate synthase component I [Steroidobacteraceae bacterium]
MRANCQGGPDQWAVLPPRLRQAAARSINSILLETSRFDACNRHSYLFQDPRRIITANRLDQLPDVFAKIELALAEGLYVAGYLSYESGYHFENLDNPHAGAAAEQALAWFGAYGAPHVFDHASGHSQGAELAHDCSREPPIESATIADDIALEISESDYAAKILRIKEYIAMGESYQVNFTDKIALAKSVPPLAAYLGLSSQQSVAYSAFLNLGDHHVLSFSPELFFRTEGSRIVTRPMKGTMPRGRDLLEDQEMALRLRNDGKNCSEHVMIVDLLRNDLGRICTPGSVQVEAPFSVERYETLHQMTSTVSGTLLPGIKYYDIFRSIFPCGSITGAPKIRTMQIISELERGPRGIYTGAIGFISPAGSSTFNVAIRTLVVSTDAVTMGVGGGIVADSDPHEEYRECLLKASFLARTRRPFRLIETMLWQRDYPLLSLHLDRLQTSSAYFNFACDRDAIASQLRELAKSFDANLRYRVRLLLASSGAISLASEEFFGGSPSCHVTVAIERTSSSDPFFRHKTTNRELYERLHKAARGAGFDEVLFTNDRGEVTEGAVSNIFVERSGRWLTPPLACGVLPGVYRRHLLETHGAAEERVLTIADLQTADVVYICNALHGVRKVTALSFGPRLIPPVERLTS